MFDSSPSVWIWANFAGPVVGDELAAGTYDVTAGGVTGYGTEEVSDLKISSGATVEFDLKLKFEGKYSEVWDR